MMYKIESRKSITAKIVFLLGALTIAILFGKQTSGGALKGIYFCAQMLVPSIFPFMVISSFIVKSGISNALEKFLGYITKPLFGLSGKCGATILLSMIGGYPVGARGINALYEQGEIDEKDAQKMAYFAVGAGPGFLITFVGINLLNSKEIGICILSAQIISVIIMGILNKYIFRNENGYNSNLELKQEFPSLTKSIVEATVSATYGILEMCGMVVIFSALNSVLEYLLGNFPQLSQITTVLLEVTTACNTLAKNNNIIMIAFAVGFAGICVHFQIFQALKDIKINKILFFFYRIIQGLITAFFTYLFIKIFNINVPVYSSISGDIQFTLSTSVIGSALLIITGICFLYTFKKFKE